MAREKAIFEIVLEAQKAKKTLSEFRRDVSNVGLTNDRLTKTFDALDRQIVKIGKGASLKNIQKGLLGVAAAAAGAGVALKKSLDIAETAARFEDSLRVFQSIGGNLEALRRSTRGLISDVELVQKANLAQTLGIDFKTTAGLARIAGAAARKTGQDFNFLFDSIVTGTARQSKLILDNLGILINTTKANERYASSIGKSARSLTDAEKKQAFLNEVLRQGEGLINQTAAAGATASERFDKMKASAENLSTEIGQTLLPTAAKLADEFNRLAEGVTESLKLNRLADAQEKAAQAVMDNRREVETLRSELARLRVVEEQARASGAAGGREIIQAAGFRDIGVLTGNIRALEDQLRAAGVQFDKLTGRDKPAGPPPAVRDIEAEAAAVQKSAEEARKAEEAQLARLEAIARKRQEAARSLAAFEADQRKEQAAIEEQAFREQVARDQAEREAALESLRQETELIDQELLLRGQARIDSAKQTQDEIERIEKEAAERRKAVQQGVIDSIRGAAVQAVNFVASVTQRALATGLQAFEDLVAGEKVALAAIVAEFLKSTGTQIVGIGVQTVASGVSKLFNQATAGVGLVEISAGVGIAGVGTAMGGAGAGLAGGLRRFAGSGFGEIQIGGGAGEPGGGPGDLPTTELRAGRGLGEGGGGAGGPVVNTFVFNAPVLAEPTQTARSITMAQRRARKDLLAPA